MAVSTPTSLKTYNTTRTASADTTSSFTPSANALLVSVFQGVTTGTCTITDSTGLTWTNINTTTYNASNRYTVAYTQVGASPSSMTVTATWGASFTGYVTGGVFQVTGHNTTTPLVAAGTKTGSGTSATFSTATVPALSSSGNLQVLVACSRGPGANPEASWTSVLGQAGVNCMTFAAYIGTPGDTSPTATDSGATSRAYAALAFEIADGGLALAPTGSDYTAQSGTATYYGVFDAFRGLVLVWP